jgi:hypothetical protein
MSRALLAEFRDADSLIRAARDVRPKHRLIDAYSPIPLEGFCELLADTGTPIRIVMAAAGFGVAACAYGLEFYSAVIDYPINSGGRPLNSWPAFVMFPFSVGILAAAVFGLLAFFVFTGLPRMHHPLFDAPGFDRVSQDCFALEVALPESEDERRVLREALEKRGAISIHEVAS